MKRSRLTVLTILALLCGGASLATAAKGSSSDRAVGRAMARTIGQLRRLDPKLAHEVEGYVKAATTGVKATAVALGRSGGSLRVPGAGGNETTIEAHSGRVPAGRSSRIVIYDHSGPLASAKILNGALVAQP